MRPPDDPTGRASRCCVNFSSRKSFLIEPTRQEIEGAWAAYDRREAAESGIVDQVSFMVMRRLSLTEAFTNDQHFRAAGFTVLF
jgi:uncharacterized protein